MFNLKEKHIVVVLILISVVFLLFLSTRSPLCVREGLNTFNYSRVNDDNSMNAAISCAKKSKNLPKDENNELKLSYKIKKSQKNRKSKNGKSYIEKQLNEYNKNNKNNKNKLSNNSVNESSDEFANDLENKTLGSLSNDRIIDNSVKNIKPIVLSKNQIQEYGVNDNTNLEEVSGLTEKTEMEDNVEKKLESIKGRGIILDNEGHKLKPFDKNSKFEETYTSKVQPNPDTSIEVNEFIENIKSESYNTVHSNRYIYPDQYNSNINVADTSNMIDEVVNPLDNKLNEKSGIIDDCNECHDENVPIGFGGFAYNSYGLLRKEIPSVRKIVQKKQYLSNDKCTTLKSAVLDLNKGGYLNNNNVESSWNNTFKESCGEW